MEEASKDFTKCLAKSENNQITYEDLLNCKRENYLDYMEKHLDAEKNSIVNYMNSL